VDHWIELSGGLYGGSDDSHVSGSFLEILRSERMMRFSLAMAYSSANLLGSTDNIDPV
jgi:hypothetical protein